MSAFFRFYFITPFQNLVECYTAGSILKRALDANLIEIHFVNPRDFTNDKHKTIDDKPFGGGPGMVYMLDPFLKALDFVKQQDDADKQITILFAPEGRLFNDTFARDFVNYFISNEKTVSLIYIIPRYEGIDARIVEFVDITVSVGPYILTGAELPSLIFTDAVIRFIPGVLGNSDSPVKDTYFRLNDMINGMKVFQEPPVFTRPAEYVYRGKKLKVPEVLRSGNHQQIKDWQKQNTKIFNVQPLRLNDIL